jgi:hypothetical protein
MRDDLRTERPECRDECRAMIVASRVEQDREWQAVLVE